jgi:hypothetical protein
MALEFINKWTHAGVAIAALVGAAPVYATAWLATQSVLIDFPIIVRERLDEWMYGEYQEFARILFQLYTGVRVEPCGRELIAVCLPRRRPATRARALLLKPPVYRCRNGACTAYFQWTGS